MWCLWNERNGCSFEDHEKTLVELKDLFFKIFFFRVAASDCRFFFFFFRSLLHYLIGFFLVYFMCIWVAPMRFLMNLRLIVKKKKD
jgi:hypothetical protein